MTQFSVLISVYKGADQSHLDMALNSLLKQKLLPSEVVIVLDGEVGVNIKEVISAFRHSAEQDFEINIKIVSLPKNQGLGIALREGLLHCSYDLVARMDADDICKPDRFAKQVAYFENNEIEVLGSSMEEFVSMPGDYGKFKVQPLSHPEIKRKARFLNPISHPTVMFRKAAVLESGSYMDMPLFEDYFLWVRMLVKGYKFANIRDSLLYFRVGNDMIGRRHGWSYLQKEFAFYKASLRLKNINYLQFSGLIITKSLLRLLPKLFMQFVYKKFARS
ncbi:Glycosyl transferase family 2 [Cnuella takakiae]|uniref:Glycosyl transferase family 2 n=1 Tax=Cnuella takakiae TaxID=1302690 RepID=A0A1M5B8W0_9BACT|nr:glycosyltransferase [Cnuella takakiae]OLY93379.1 hypothetical protein BUE76_16945 [Cnuella takakiae]SHF38836.1 Glycosyl transferase family 2 [Cnuella takakiae]